MKSQIHTMTLIRYSAKGKQTRFDIRCNAVAASSNTGELMFLSGAVSAGAARATAAAIRSNQGFAIGGKVIGKAGESEHGYKVFLSRLPKYATAHLVAVASTPRLLIGDLDDQLFRFLQSREVTTPILPEWVPKIRMLLKRKALIRHTNGFGCDVSIAEFGTQEVDEIVSKLLASRKVRI